MTTLRIYRGLPASGKTTLAKAWVNEDVSHRARVNRDDLRQQLHSGVFVKGVTEGQIIVARDALIRELLKKGVDVASDDTNLPNRTIRDLVRVAASAGASYEIVDLSHVSLDECVARDYERLFDGDTPVGHTVIHDLYNRFVRGKGCPLPVSLDISDPEVVEVYVKPSVFDSSKRSAYIVDIDGTVALKGTRSPFDESRVHEDRPNEDVISVIQTLRSRGYFIIFMSGRTAGCRAATQEWLRKHIFDSDKDFSLYMREEGDNRKDSVVKLELFNKYLRDNYAIEGVFDDRKQVVKMWRELGLTCFQVAEGDF